MARSLINSANLTGDCTDCMTNSIHSGFSLERMTQSWLSTEGANARHALDSLGCMLNSSLIIAERRWGFKAHRANTSSRA